MKNQPIRIPDYIENGSIIPNQILALQQGNWQLNFILNETVAAGEILVFYAHGGRNVQGKWQKLQNTSPAEDGFVQLKTADGIAMSPTFMSNDFGLFKFQTPVTLKKEQTVVAFLGNAIAPKLSYFHKIVLLMKSMPQHKLEVDGSAPYADVLNEETKTQIIGACVFEIKGNQFKKLTVTAPSSVQCQQEFEIFVRPEDISGNISYQTPKYSSLKCYDQEGTLKWLLEGKELLEACRVVSIPEIPTILNCFRIGHLKLADTGIFRFVIETEEGIKAISNPVKCEQILSTKTLWGMIHAHTEISDGAGSIHEHLAHIRDCCNLDFGAVSDHDHLWETTDNMWNLVQTAVKHHNSPGKFTVFLGYEWAKWRHNGDGDRNVYYLNDNEPMFRSDDGCYPNPQSLFNALRNKEAIIIPHHPAEDGNYCDYKDHFPDKERLIEIYSSWGSSETTENGNKFPVFHPNHKGSVQNALASGWQVGFTAGGDDHVGHAGDNTATGTRPTPYKAGLFAVKTASNDRRSIWHSMFHRNCYGTTGARIIIDYSIDGFPMGTVINLDDFKTTSEAKTADLENIRHIKIELSGTAPIEKIDIIRNNKIIKSMNPTGKYISFGDTNMAGIFDITVNYLDNQPLKNIHLPPAKFCDSPFTFYYIRATQVDGEMVWASPIWII